MLIAARPAMNDNATTVMPTLPQSRPKPSIRLSPNARDAVEAEVMPEHITTKATMNVKNCMPKALWAYNAAPAARSEEHTSELQSLMRISYAVFCLKKNK